jgi:ParB-like chromosome segregation protein Spo0J
MAVVPLAKFSTNRRDSLRFSEAGVDWLALSFPVKGYDPKAWDHSEQIIRDKGVGSRRTDKGGKRMWAHRPVRRSAVSISLTQVEERGVLAGRVEFNPARVIDPEGYSPCPYSNLMGTLAEVLPLVQRCLDVGLPPEEWRVARVDVARDFHVRSPRTFIEGLRGVRPRYRPQVNLRGRGDGMTLELRTRSSGMVRLYDKHEQSEGLAPPGTLRFEVEARGSRGWAERYGGIKVARDLTPGRLDDLLADRWEWTGFGSWVGGTGVAQALESMKGLGVSPSRRQAFLGWFIEVSLGGDDSLSHTRQAEYNRFLRQLGIVPTFPALSAAGPMRRLDLQTGREVVERVSPTAARGGDKWLIPPGLSPPDGPDRVQRPSTRLGAGDGRLRGDSKNPRGHEGRAPHLKEVTPMTEATATGPELEEGGWSMLETAFGDDESELGSVAERGPGDVPGDRAMPENGEAPEPGQLGEEAQESEVREQNQPRRRVGKPPPGNTPLSGQRPLEEQPRLMRLPLSAITVNPDIQVRRGLDGETVDKYKETFALLPPVEVINVQGGRSLLCDGFHRLAAAEELGIDEIAVSVETGTVEKAIERAVTRNWNHGKPFTRQERDIAIRRLHNVGWSLRRIAKETGVSYMTVSRVIDPPSPKPKRREAFTREVRDATLPPAEGDEDRRMPVTNVTGRRSLEQAPPPVATSLNEGWTRSVASERGDGARSAHGRLFQAVELGVDAIVRARKVEPEALLGSHGTDLELLVEQIPKAIGYLRKLLLVAKSTLPMLDRGAG